MSLTLRAFLALVFGLLAVIVITAAVLFLDLRRAHREAVLDRLSVTAGELRQGIEARLNFGQPLPLLTEAQNLIDAERSALLGRGSIEVIGAGGRVLRATDRLRIGETVPASYLTAAGGIPRDLWRRPVDGALAVGIPILDGFGVPVGMVVVTESDARGEVRAADALSLVALAGGLLLLLLTPAAYFGVRVAFDPLTRSADRLAQAARRLRRQDIKGGMEAKPPEAADPRSAAYIRRAHEALTDLGAASAAVETLDGNS